MVLKEKHNSYNCEIVKTQKLFLNVCHIKKLMRKKQLWVIVTQL